MTSLHFTILLLIYSSIHITVTISTLQKIKMSIWLANDIILIIILILSYETRGADVFQLTRRSWLIAIK